MAHEIAESIINNSKITVGVNSESCDLSLKSVYSINGLWTKADIVENAPKIRINGIFEQIHKVFVVPASANDQKFEIP